MTPDELVEKVALAMSNVDWCGAQINGVLVLCDDPRLPKEVRAGECFCRKQAPAAIAMALEQAAKEALATEEERIGVPCPDGKRGCAVFHFQRVQRPRNPREIAAAIRALIKEPT